MGLSWGGCCAVWMVLPEGIWQLHAPVPAALSLSLCPLTAGGRAELCQQSAQTELQLLHCTTAPFAIALQSLLFCVPSALQSQ